jgi:hypothetical protein
MSTTAKIQAVACTAHVNQGILEKSKQKRL